MATTEYRKILTRGDLAANLAAVILAAREIAICTDTLQLLLGDGATAGGFPLGHLLADYNAQAGNYTLVLGDRFKVIEMTSAGANALTVPPNASVAFPIGTRIPGWTVGAGVTTLTPGFGVTLSARGATLKSAGQYAAWILEKRGTNLWYVTGDLVA